jgi:hypothetical protein
MRCVEAEKGESRIERERTMVTGVRAEGIIGGVGSRVYSHCMSERDWRQ